MREHRSESSHSITTERDWSGLPPEMIHLILKKLPDISDLIRFRAVCPHWRSSVLLSDPSLRLPWRCYWPNESSSDLLCHSLSCNKTYTIDVPQLRHGKEICGTVHQYILLFDPRFSSFSLVNPLTRKEIPLPPLPTYERWFYYTLQIEPDFFRSGESDYVVLCGKTLFDRTMSFCRISDEKWSTIEANMSYKYFYHNGIYYADSINETVATDIKTGAALYTIPPPPNPRPGGKRKGSFLMKISGELIKVFIVNDCVKIHMVDFETSKNDIEAYMLDHDNGKPSWTKYEIKDQMLFIANSGSFALNANDFTGFKEKCLYYERSHVNSMGNDYIKGLYKHDIETGITEELVCFPRCKNLWIFPNLI